MLAPLSNRRTPTFADVRGTLALAGPIALGQVGIMMMGVVDTAMVGGLGPAAVGAVGVGSSLFSACFMFGLGLLLGIDRVAGMAFGAGKVQECRDVLAHGARIAVAVSIPLIAILLILSTNLKALGIAPHLVPIAAGYTRVLALSLLPTLLFNALRQTLQAMGDAKGPTIVLLVANLVNVAGNHVLIHGLGPIPAMGAVGSAWSTLGSRLFMLTALGMYAWRKGVIGHVDRPTGAWDQRHTLSLLRLGVPAAFQTLMEVGVFATATVLAGGLGEVPAAAHQIVLVVSSFTFMVPLGTGSAGAVRVAQAIGRSDPAGAARAGWAAVSIGVGFMAVMSVMMLLFSGPILHVFTPDAATVELGKKLMVCAGLFQIFDGAQITFQGVLRGAGETMRPMFANMVGHWVFGLPIGCLLCYGAGWGIVGLWIGLSTGLAVVAVTLLVVWVRRMNGTEVLSPSENGLATE